MALSNTYPGNYPHTFPGHSAGKIPSSVSGFPAGTVSRRHSVVSHWLWACLFCVLAVLNPAALAQEDTSDSETASGSAAGYRLGAGDTINIRVLGEEDLSLEIEIGESGSITYPLLREVQVRGMTITELENRMTRRLIDEEFLIDPDVSINIVEYRPFYISGEVEQPGSYPFEPGLTLRRAVSLAGGFTERASRTRITVLDDDNEEIEVEAGDDILDMQVNPGYTITVSQRFF